LEWRTFGQEPGVRPRTLRREEEAEERKRTRSLNLKRRRRDPRAQARTDSTVHGHGKYPRGTDEDAGPSGTD